MNNDEKKGLNEMLNEIIRCTNRAKKLLNDQSNMTEVYSNLKTAHNAIKN